MKENDNFQAPAAEEMVVLVIKKHKKKLVLGVRRMSSFSFGCVVFSVSGCARGDRGQAAGYASLELRYWA